MAGKIVFYQLGQKFLDRQEDMPKEAKQVVYYSLAIGHHIGVIDCLKPILDIPEAAYERWMSAFPEGAARSKLEGVLKWGEINIDSSHIRTLANALDTAQAQFDEESAQWAQGLMRGLQAIALEPAIYLIARRREARP